MSRSRVKVKKLEWKHNRARTGLFNSDLVYCIHDFINDYKASVTFEGSINQYAVLLGTFNNDRQAKDCCQAHYEKLVLSGIVDLEQLFEKHKEEVENSEPTGFEQWEMEYNGYKETEDES